MRWMLVGLGLFFASRARAQGPGFSLQSFRPAVDSQGMVTVNASRTLPHLDYSLGLIGSYAYRSLSLGDDTNVFHVDHLVTAQLQAALGLLGGPRYAARMHGVSLQLGLSLPIHILSGERSPTLSPGDPSYKGSLSFSAQGVGDVGLSLKARFLDEARHHLGLALLFTVRFPSGRSEQLLGEGQASYHPELIVDRSFGPERRFRLALELGVLVRPARHTFVDVETQLARTLGSQLSFSAGASYAVVPHRLDLVLELVGAHDLSGAMGGTPVEVLAAAKVYLATSSFFEIGASAGASPPRIVEDHSNMTGQPLARVFVGFVFEPTAAVRDHDGEQPAPRPAPPPPPAPPPAPEPVRVVRHGGQLTTFEKVYFKTASAEILPRSFPLLDDVASLLEANQDILLLEIAGHADERGNDDYNRRLTEARAQSVRRYLITRGIAGARLTAHGYGEQEPALDEQTQRPCIGHDERCWEKNRRVEFRILSQ